MRRQHLVRTAGTALAAVLALTLTGCGGDDDTSTARSGDNALPSGGSIPGKTEPGSTDSATSGTDEKKSSSAPAKSSKAKSGEMTFEQITKMLSASMTKGGTAVVTMKASQAEATTETSGLIDYRSNPPAMSLTSKVAALGGAESTVIMVDNVMYMDMGEMSQGKFLKMPLDGDTAQMLDLSQLDPASAFEKIYGRDGTVVDRGEEKLKSGTAHRYDVEVSTKKLRDDLPEAVRGDMPTTAKYSFWFDGDDMVRQVVVDLGKAGTTTMNYDQWGTDVSIKAPAASDVTEMPQTPAMPEAPSN